MKISEGVIRLGLRPRRITPSSVSIILHKILSLIHELLIMRLERRTTKGSSSGRIMRLVPAFILEAHNQTNYDTASFVTVLLVQ